MKICGDKIENIMNELANDLMQCSSESKVLVHKAELGCYETMVFSIEAKRLDNEDAFADELDMTPRDIFKGE